MGLAASLYVEIGADSSKAERALGNLKTAISGSAKDFQSLSELTVRAGGDFRGLGSNIDNWIGTLKAATPENARFAAASADVWQSFQDGKIGAADAAKGLEQIKNQMAQVERQSKGFTGVFGKIKEMGANLKAGMSSAVESMTGLPISMLSGASAAALLVSGVKKSVDAASDLAETENKVKVVFGDASDAILDFGKNAASSLGMNKNAALQAAGTYGNLFVSMGMTVQKSAEMSTNIVKLGADLASFNNIDPTEAMEKLRAGLVGETEPLRALGVNLSAAAVEQKAFSLGLATSKDDLTAAAKAQATYALILEQTKTAQGDFDRTSTGLANSQRILKANFEDLSATMGQVFIPAVNWMTVKLNEGIKVINDLVTWNERLKKSLDEHARDVTVAATSYDAYVKEMQRAYTVAGLQVKVTEDGIKVYQRQGSYLADVTSKYNLLSEAEFRAQQGSLQAADAAMTQADQMLASGYAVDHTTDAIEALRAQAAGSPVEIRDSAQAISDLKGSADALTPALDAVKASEEAAAQKAKDLADLTDKAREAQQNFIETKKEWMEGAGGDVAQLLDQEKLGTDKYEAALKVIDRTMGTNLKTQYDQKNAMADLVNKYQTGKISAEEFGTGLGSLTDQFMPLDEKVNEARQSLIELQAQLQSMGGTLYINVDYNSNASSSNADTSETTDYSNGDYEGTAKGYATGGYPPVGKAVKVGEGGPEWAVFGSPARVYPNGTAPEMGGQNVTVNIQVNGSGVRDATVLSNEIARQVKNALRSGTRGLV